MTAPKMTKIVDFCVEHLQFIDKDSKPTQALPPTATADHMLKCYKLMSLTRLFDIKAVNLQRTGQLGTYPSCRGQEAVGVGMGSALQATDVFCPYYRDQGCLIARGHPLSEILLAWGGDERGNDYSTPQAQEDFPNCVPIGTQLLHATGIAYAIKYREQSRAVLTACGDGGTSQGDFYEALNVAGQWQLPVVFIVNNNQWAISIPRSEQTNTQTLAQKAIAAGIPGHQVDGNDVIAMHYAVDEALKKARNGGGPTLIEAITYRLSDHTTADDASRYQPSEEVKSAWKEEPIKRLAYFLESKNLWSSEQETALQNELQATLQTAINQYLETPTPKATDMFDHLYAELPKDVAAQRESLGDAS